jgi:hypothetical protein
MNWWANLDDQPSDKKATIIGAQVRLGVAVDRHPKAVEALEVLDGRHLPLRLERSSA